MKSRALQDKVTPELKSLAVQVSKLQREHPKEFQSLADKAAEFFLELFHVKEPHLNGDEGDLIEGRAACWPMLQYPYTTSQELYLWTVSLCCLTDALLPHRKKILPDTFPFVLLRNNILYGGDKLGFDLLLLSDGLEQLTAEIESSAGGGLLAEPTKEPLPETNNRPTCTLKKFIETGCNIIHGDAIESKVQLIYKAAAAGRIELPKEAARWENGRAKIFYEDDLRVLWSSYTKEIPSLFRLK